MSILLTESASWDVTAADLDVRDLQARFGELFDRAARALYAYGLDQDDVVFDRFLVCEVGGRRMVVPADWLSDRERLVHQILRSLAESGVTDRGEIRICELKVVVRRDDRPNAKHL